MAAAQPQPDPNRQERRQAQREAERIPRLLKGDTEALNDFLHLVYPDLRMQAKILIGAASDRSAHVSPDDAAQTAVQRALEHLDTYRGLRSDDPEEIRRHFRAWLLRIVFNTTMSLLRGGSRKDWARVVEVKRMRGNDLSSADEFIHDMDLLRDSSRMDSTDFAVVRLFMAGQSKRAVMRTLSLSRADLDLRIRKYKDILAG